MADTRPDFGQLNRMMPELIRGNTVRKRLQRSVSPIAKEQPQKSCPCCGKIYDMVTSFREILAKQEACSECQKKLDDGWTCFAGDGRIIWAELNELEMIAYRGRLILTDKEGMDMISAKGSPPPKLT